MTTERLMPGHVSRAQIEGDETSIVENFPTTADGIDWMVLGDYDRFREFATVEDGYDFGRRGYGGYQFDWEIMMSPQMTAWLRQHIADGVYSAPVTVVTLDTVTGLSDLWRVINATLVWPAPDALTRQDYNPYWTYPLRFVNGVDAPSGPDLDVDLTYTGTLVVGSAKTFNVNVINVGDAATYADTVLTVAIGNRLRYTSHSASGWTVTYSTNGTSYSGTPPGDLTTITHLRFTRTALEASATASLTISLTPFDEGAINPVAIISTAGDQDAANNTAAATGTAYAVPVAGISVDTNNGPAPLTVNFSDSSSGLGRTVAWDFTNNGSTDSTSPTTSFVYATPGVYTARLTVTNPAGSATTTMEITVS